MNGTYAVLIATIITLGFAAAVYQDFQSSPVITVTAVNVLTTSQGVKDFLVQGSPVIPVPFSVKAQGFFGVRLNFTNTGNRTVYVNNIVADTPDFLISSTYFSESLPLSVPPGVSKTLYVAVQVGSEGYSGEFNLTVVTSYS